MIIIAILNGIHKYTVTLIIIAYEIIQRIHLILWETIENERLRNFEIRLLFPNRRNIYFVAIKKT